MLITILTAFVCLFQSSDTIVYKDTISNKDTIVLLEGVEIIGNEERDFILSSSQNKVQIDNNYLKNHFAGSLPQSLENIPGVKAMSIGVNQSKPTIRGMGFNRMLVAENGIKHEGQQWGDDHGLEINQFSVDRIEIIKGPSALLFGSDAIGGVINLFTNYASVKNFQANATLFSQTNNQQLGFAIKTGGKLNDKFFYRADISFSDYSDYKITADSIQYYSYWIKLKNKRLRNTAGKDRNADILLGYMTNNFHTDIKISDNYAKSGFFANAHGLEVRLSDINYDKSIRDIDLPYQQVNHFKILSHTVWSKKQNTVEANLAYQNNYRQEFSEPLSHGYMPTPDNSLERQFNKDTYTANINIMTVLNHKNFLRYGINSEYQSNKIDGWGFIIPEFQELTFGIYAFDKWTVNNNLIVNAGVRYDYANIHINSYKDWFLTPINNSDSIYKQRSQDIKRYFNSITYAIGFTYNIKDWILKTNIGKSFRIPIAKELGADGVNYHIFRYEKGNNKLSAEESYQLDIVINYGNNKFTFEIDPYLNYFPNYIYLNPTSKYTEGLQTYYYTQTEVFRYGFEFQAIYSVNKFFDMEFKGEYLYSRQLAGDKKGYTLPFSTPYSMDCNFKYKFDTNKDNFLSVNLHIVGKQNEIVPPEKATDGYFTLNLAFSKQFFIKQNILHTSLQFRNILNKRYFDHTSYYRLIDVPEPCRNISIIISMDI